MPDTIYDSAQTCGPDKARQALRQALRASCRIRRRRLIRPTIRHKPVGMIRRDKRRIRRYAPIVGYGMNALSGLQLGIDLQARQDATGVTPGIVRQLPDVA